MTIKWIIFVINATVADVQKNVGFQELFKKAQDFKQPKYEEDSAKFDWSPFDSKHDSDPSKDLTYVAITDDVLTICPQPG